MSFSVPRDGARDLGDNPVYLSDKRPINLFALSPTPLPLRTPAHHTRIKAASSNLSVYRRYGSRDGFAPEGLLFPLPREDGEGGGWPWDGRGQGWKTKGGKSRDEVSSTVPWVYPPPAYRDSYEFPDPRHLAGITLATVGVVGPRLLIELWNNATPPRAYQHLHWIPGRK